MYLYIYKDYKKNKLTTDDLVYKALEQYEQELARDYADMSAEIMCTESGKPYFAEIPVKFSVSHSEGLWVCLMSDTDVGVDIQFVKDCKYLKLAERFFLDEERALAEREGLAAFFSVWTKKEACGKLFGKGISGGMLQLPVLEFEREKKIIFEEAEISRDFICCCCSKEKRKIWKRTIT